MRTLTILAGLILTFIFFSCEKDDNPAGASSTAVTYKVYDGYYYIGARPQGDSTMYFWTTTASRFDSLFTYFYFNGPVDTIPRADLASKNVVSFVKYGNDMYNINVDTVYLSAKTLYVKYSDAVTDSNMTSTLAQSYIIVTDAAFEKVLYYENGNMDQGIIRP